jgi:hypothetical protein
VVVIAECHTLVFIGVWWLAYRFGGLAPEPAAAIAAFAAGLVGLATGKWSDLPTGRSCPFRRAEVTTGLGDGPGAPRGVAAQVVIGNISAEPAAWQDLSGQQPGQRIPHGEP